LIIVLAGEVLFMEMIEKTAREESTDCLILNDEEAFWVALQEETPKVVFLETGFSSFDAPELVQKLKRNPSTRGIQVVVFGNSLRADLLQDAQEAGADLVLPKSAFREQVRELIRHYDKGHP
jgi:CheY-like chemotaxis protein